MGADLSVLGVDPALNRSGWALLKRDNDATVVVASGSIAAHAGPRSERLHDIAGAFDRVLKSWRPDVVYLEQPGSWQRRGGTRRETLEALAMSRGVFFLVCARHRVPAHDADISVARKAVVGRFNAGAKDILEAVWRRGIDVPLRPRGGPDLDIANAIVIGLYGLHLEC
jgi:crossover junction endodeoxyribonuclease RuvC